MRFANRSVRCRNGDSKNGVRIPESAPNAVASVRVASETAEQIVLGDAKLGVLAQFFALMRRHGIEEMRRPLGEIFTVDPARADQRPIDMVFDHPLECPGLRARLQRQRRVEIETVFGFEMGADEGGISDGLSLVDDVGQLPLGRGRRPCLLLAIGKTGHFELDFGLGHKGADFRQAEPGAKAIKGNHAGLPIFQDLPAKCACKTCPSLATPCCHHGVSSVESPCEAALASAVSAGQQGQLPLREDAHCCE